VPQVVYAEHGHRYHDLNAASIPDGTRVPGIHAPGDTPLLAYADGWVHALRTGRAIGAWSRVLLKVAVARSQRRPRPAPATIDPNADGDGLDRETLARIDRLEARLGAATLVRLARVLLGPLAGQAFPYIVAAILGRLALRGRRWIRPAWTVATSSAAVASLVQYRDRYWPPWRSTAYALDAARALSAILERGRGCPTRDCPWATRTCRQ
jgi:hypothetical protein